MKSLILILVLAGGCQDPHHPIVGDPCDAAEKNLQRLECKDYRGRLIGGPTLRGVAFSDVCRELRQKEADMNPTCLAQVRTCAEVSTCP